MLNLSIKQIGDISSSILEKENQHADKVGQYQSRSVTSAEAQKQLIAAVGEAEKQLGMRKVRKYDSVPELAGSPAYRIARVEQMLGRLAGGVSDRDGLLDWPQWEIKNLLNNSDLSIEERVNVALHIQEVLATLSPASPGMKVRYEAFSEVVADQLHVLLQSNSQEDGSRSSTSQSGAESEDNEVSVNGYVVLPSPDASLNSIELPPVFNQKLDDVIANKPGNNVPMLMEQIDAMKQDKGFRGFLRKTIKKLKTALENKNISKPRHAILSGLMEFCTYLLEKTTPEPVAKFTVPPRAGFYEQLFGSNDLAADDDDGFVTAEEGDDPDQTVPVKQRTHRAQETPAAKESTSAAAPAAAKVQIQPGAPAEIERLAGPGLNNPGNLCWFNSSTHLMMTLLDVDDIELLKDQNYEHLANPQPFRDLRDKTVALWHEFRKVRSGETSGKVDQCKRDVLKSLHNCGQAGGGGGVLKELFPTANPTAQQDTAGCLHGWIDSLGLSSSPKYSLKRKETIHLSCDGKDVSRPGGTGRGTENITGVLDVSLNARSDSLRFLAETMTDAAAEQLSQMAIGADLEPVREQLLALRALVGRPGTESTDLQRQEVLLRDELLKTRLRGQVISDRQGRLSVPERVKLARDVGTMLGLDQSRLLDPKKLGDFERDVSMKECMNRDKISDVREVRWNIQLMEEHKVPWDFWYPAFLRWQKVPEAEITRKIDQGELEETYQMHELAGVFEEVKKEDGLLLPSRVGHHIEVSDSSLKRFVVNLRMFESDNERGEIKRGDAATQALINGGDPIELDAVDSQTGKPATVRARLKSLTCHAGRSAKSGHYINLTIDDDGKVTVHNDSRVTTLSDGDYLGYLKRSGFAPVTALYEKV